MRGYSEFCQRGFNSDNVFFVVDEGRRSKYHYNLVSNEQMRKHDTNNTNDPQKRLPM